MSLLQSRGRGVFLRRRGTSTIDVKGRLVSIVVPHRNDLAGLRDCLRSLLNQDHSPLEIIVVDDGSSAGIANAISAEWSAVVRVVAFEHAGPAAARNAGARVASGEVLVFCESDATYPPTYVSEICKPILTSYDNEVVAASNVGRRIMAEGGGLGHRYARLLYAAVDDAIRSGVRKTGAWAYEAAWFKASGGYRNDLFIGEDMELAERVVLEGRVVAYGGDVPFYHREPKSLRDVFWRAWRSGAGVERTIVLPAGITAIAVTLVLVFLIPTALFLATLVVVFGLLVVCDGTWRLVVKYALRAGRWRELPAASLGRGAWAAGYFCGALLGRLKSRRGQAR
jgi:glycosyltransferase involved in cell wall biosynthesis